MVPEETTAEELPEIDFSAPMMTRNGYKVTHRPDLFVIEGETGRHSVVDKYGRTTLNKIRRVFPASMDAEEIKATAVSKYPQSDPIEAEKRRQERKAINAAKEKARLTKEKDRMVGLKRVIGRLPVGHEIDPGRAATQVAKYSGETKLTVFWWLIRISKNQPQHPARAYMADAGTTYMVLFNPGKLEADDAA